MAEKQIVGRSSRYILFACCCQSEIISNATTFKENIEQTADQLNLLINFIKIDQDKGGCYGLLTIDSGVNILINTYLQSSNVCLIINERYNSNIYPFVLALNKLLKATSLIGLGSGSEINPSSTNSPT